MVERVNDALEATLTAWQNYGKDFGYDAKARYIIEKHFKRIPLCGIS
jgi:hypothetical protein